MQTYRTPSRTITVEHGREGPRHDPYSYREITINRAGYAEITFHEGLGVWLQWGKGNRDDSLTENEMVQVVEHHLGCSLRHFERACERVYNTCRECGGHVVGSMLGFPGETLNLCAQGHIVSGSFNEGAVI